MELGETGPAADRSASVVQWECAPRRRRARAARDAAVHISRRGRVGGLREWRFLHIDFDVLDPADMPARVGIAPGGASGGCSRAAGAGHGVVHGHRGGGHLDRAGHATLAREVLRRAWPMTRQASLLAAARAGDSGRFARLVEPMHRELHAYCYRICSAGSTTSRMRCRRRSSARGGRSTASRTARSIRPWLYRIATNRCLTLIERRGRRELPTDLALGSPPPPRRPGWSRTPGLEAESWRARGSRTAFVAALQRLTALSARFVLRRLVGFSAPRRPTCSRPPSRQQRPAARQQRDR